MFGGTPDILEIPSIIFYAFGILLAFYILESNDIFEFIKLGPIYVLGLFS